MPTVPTYDTAQVAPEGLPGVQLQGLSPRQLAQGEIQGRATEQTGQNVQNMGVSDIDAAAKAQMMANQVRVDAALNQVRATQQKLTYDPADGYLSQKGAAAINPNDQGQGLQAQYNQKLQDTISSVSANLGNDAQRQVFAQHAANLTTQFDGQIQSHVLQEYKQFGLETQKGTVDLATDTAQRNYANPEIIDAQVQSAKAAVWKAGQINGDPANLTQAKMLEITSNIHAGVIGAALQDNNPLYAQQYINNYKNDMTAGDLLKARGQITKALDSQMSTSLAQTVISKYQSAFSPTTTDRFVQITKAAESNGKDLTVSGTPVTSATGAKYAMQVMPDTAANPGHGIQPAQADTPAEYNRVGTQLLGALVNKYAGDPAKAWAAYNAGEGNVDKAIIDAGKGGDWMGALAKYQSPENHQQTMAYVTKNVSQLTSGGGAPPVPSLADVHNDVRASLGTNPEPRLLSAALNESTRQYNEMMNDRKVQGENAVQQAQTYLIQNKGDFDSMPPDMKAQITALAPDKWDQLQTFAKGVANPPKADNMPAYFSAMAHPDELGKMTDTQFQNFAMTNFSESTQKQVAKMRDDQINGKSDLSAEGLNVKVLNSELNNRLNAMGLTNIASPAKGDADSIQQRATIQKFLTDGVFDQQQQLGRKMTPQEMTQFVDGQFLKNYAFHNTYFGIPGSPQETPLLQMKKSDIPSEQLTQITQALANHGINNPTEDQIMRTFWKVKTNAGR